MRRTALSLLLLAIIACAMPLPAALADGDPGSDVLVYQPLFLAADAGVSLQQQVTLGRLLSAASRDGFPIRVAIIASPSDLGAITGLWLKPRSYARFLGLELSLAYSGRLLVVMPDGFGFNWPGHAATAAYTSLSSVRIGNSGAGLAYAARTAVRSLAARAGVRLAAPSQPSSQTATASHSGERGTAGAHGASDPALLILLLLAAACALALAGRLALVRRDRLVRRWRARRARANAQTSEAMSRRARRRLLRPGVALTVVLAIALGVGILVLPVRSPSSAALSGSLAANPSLDSGTPISGRAPGFTLTDQFGQPISLRAFRGKVVLLAFNDSECTTICPLTTTAMLDAKAMLGAAGGRVQLLGIDANPKATALEDVLSYSQLHGMLHAWHFLTGSLSQLEQVWKDYRIEAAVEGGQIAHTPALFMIDAHGNEAKLYVTQQSYAAVGQLGQLLAEEASRLLPGHPPVHSNISYSQINGIGPSASVTLPRARGGSISVGPGRPRLSLFFATWDQEVTSLAGQLEALNGYSSAAASARLPPLTAIDEGSVEPSSTALSRFLAGLRAPLSFPVAVDRSGRVADGYEVQGEPWFVLTSATGRILWYWQVSTSGWLSRAALVGHVRDALARAPKLAPGAAQQELAGSPQPLAGLHQQAGQLLGAEPSLAARIKALRGYPIVINAWASWCTPCRAEFGLFANASARYGREVAFLGADNDDSASDASSFLAQHPVSYPSYQTSTTNITAIVPQGLVGLPTTIFINRAGTLAYVHTGQYVTQGTLDADIATYALGG